MPDRKGSSEKLSKLYMYNLVNIERTSLTIDSLVPPMGSFSKRLE